MITEAGSIASLNALVSPLVLNALAAASGLDEVKRQLGEMLGDEVGRVVLKEYTDRMSAQRRNGGLAVAKSTAGTLGVGAATAARSAIPPNTFFGSE